MLKEYDFQTRQRTAQAQLESRRLPKFMTGNNGSSTSEGLKKMIIEISTFILQAPTSLGNDDHKIRYLRCAVLDAPRAQTAISQLSTMQYSFYQFFTLCATAYSFKLRTMIVRLRLFLINVTEC